MTKAKNEWHEVTADAAQIAREREKARKMRKSQWWQDKLNQGLCHYCRRTFPPESLTMDHIVPLARGGRSTHGNIVASCLECNAGKKLSTPVEQLLDGLRKEREGREDE